MDDPFRNTAIAANYILNSSQEVKFIDEFCNAISYSHCSLQCLKYSHIINTLRHTSVEYIL